MTKIISLEVAEAEYGYRMFYTKIVETCISLRKARRHSLQTVSDEIAVNRQRISKFEKLLIHDMVLASNYLNFYNKELTFSIK